MLAFCCCSTSLKAQVITNVDSLQQLYEQETDTLQKVRHLNAIAITFRHADTSKYLTLLRQCFDLLPERNFRERGVLYFNLGSFYSEISDSSRAFPYFDSALYCFDQIDLEAFKAEVYGHYGSAYIGYELYKKGADYIYKAISINKKIGNQRGYGHNLMSLQSIATLQGQREKALKYLQEALAVFKAVEDPYGIAISYLNIGQQYYLNNPDTAIANYLKALPLLEMMENYPVLLQAYLDLASLYEQKEAWELANIYYEKALVYKDYLRNDYEQADFYQSLALIYYYGEKYNQAVVYYKKALVIFDSLHYISDQTAVNAGIAYCYRELDSFQLAYEYFEVAYNTRDSVLKKLNEDEIKELEVKYELEKHEQANLLLTQERNLEKVKAQRNWQIAMAIAVVLMLVVIISFLLIQRNKIATSKETLQLKHQLLRNQMNPHFIFNSLTAIQSFVYRSEPRSAGKYLASFAKLVRAILDNSRKEYISLEKELQWLENYLSLQLLRFEHKFEYQIEVDPALDHANTLMPPMLTQPFIENALEHGLKHIKHKGNLKVSLQLVGEQLQVQVQDNGIGFDKKQASTTSKEHESLALKITEERLSYLNKKRQEKIYFNITSHLNQGTVVSFSIPLKQSENQA